TATGNCPRRSASSAGRWRRSSAAARGRGTSSACCNSWPATRWSGSSRPSPCAGRAATPTRPQSPPRPRSSPVPRGRGVTAICHRVPVGCHSTPPRCPRSGCRRRTCPGSTAFCPTAKPKEDPLMTRPTALLLRANLKQLRLPTMLAECEKLAREAAANDEPYEGYLLRLTEAEVAARSANALAARIRAAAFPVTKDFDTYDFSVMPGLPKQRVLELARGEWVEQRYNCCLIGNAGTGKTHLATALGLAAC